MNEPRADAEGDGPLEAPGACSRWSGKGTVPLSTPPKKFDAYHRWLGIPPGEQPPDHYRLLGVPRFEADPDVIQSAADQRMAHLRTFQAGPHGKLSQKLLNEVAAAKVCLLQPDKKAAYDRQLREKLQSDSPNGSPPAAVTPPAPIPVASVGSTGSTPPPLPSIAPPRRRHASPATIAVSLGAGLAVVVGLVLWGSSRPSGDAGKQTAAVDNGQAEITKPPTVEREAKRQRGQAARSAPQDAEKARSAVRPDAGSALATAPPVAAEVPPEVETDPTPPGFDPPVFVPPSAAEKPVAKEVVAKPQAAARAPSPRLPVPPEDVQRRVAEQLDKIHDVDGAGTSGEKLKLARRLFDAARDSGEKPNERYVLLRKGMELASEAGDAALVLAAAGEIGKRFDVDAAALQETALVELAPKATDAEAVEGFVKASRGVIERAVAAERFEAALELASLAQRACQRPQGRKVRKEAAQRLTWVQELGERHQQVRQARATLKADPENPEANLFLGRWYCLDQGDWHRGLPHLTKAGDDGLKALVQQELVSPPTTQDAKLKLADAWWDLAQERKGDDHDLAMLRAGHWYKQAQDVQASGLLRLKIEKRLEEVAKVEQAQKAEQQRLQPPAKDAKHSLWSDVL